MVNLNPHGMIMPKPIIKYGKLSASALLLIFHTIASKMKQASSALKEQIKTEKIEGERISVFYPYLEIRN